MKKTLIIILLAIGTYLLPTASVYAQGQDLKPARTALSDSAFASLITCGDGDEFYTSWGHTALRICDPAQGLDYIYNYGTFDFDTPHFYWKFACGRLNYCLSRSDFNHFMFTYSYEQRAVWEQRLRLMPQELNNLFLMMEQNYLPEYRYYLYDFFRDNCATRVRDMIANCLCHRTLSPEQMAESNLTYRDHLHRATGRTLMWWQLGVDITLGMRCDKRCTNYEYMFSPIEMMHIFDTLTVSDTGLPLAEPAVRLLDDVRTPMSKSLPPAIVFWGVFVVAAVLTFMEWKKGWRLKAVDRILYILTSLVSVVVIFLWFFTTHYCTKYNLNILWASPLFIYFTVRTWGKAVPCLTGITGARAGIYRWMVWIQVVMLLVAVVLCFLPYPQSLNKALCPLCLTLILRLLASNRLQKNTKNNLQG